MTGNYTQMDRQIQISISQAKVIRGKLTSTARFIKQLYELRGQHLYGDYYAEVQAKELLALAKSLDRKIKQAEAIK